MKKPRWPPSQDKVMILDYMVKQKNNSKETRNFIEPITLCCVDGQSKMATITKLIYHRTLRWSYHRAWTSWENGKYLFSEIRNFIASKLNIKRCCTIFCFVFVLIRFLIWLPSPDKFKQILCPHFFYQIVQLSLFDMLRLYHTSLCVALYSKNYRRQIENQVRDYRLWFQLLIACLLLLRGIFPRGWKCWGNIFASIATFKIISVILLRSGLYW